MIDGDPNAPVLIIGMAPGQDELESGRPFTGPSGNFLWKYLSRAGISRADCFIVNTINEWPEGSDGNPTQTQLEKYWDAFDSAMASSKARVALILGGAALKRFTGLEGGIEAWRGYLLDWSHRGVLSRTKLVETVYKTGNTKKGIKKGDPRIIKTKESVTCVWPETLAHGIATIHPAAVLRTGFATTPVFAKDLMRVGRALRGELKPVSVVYGTKPFTLWDPKTGIETFERVTFDIETGMLDGTIIRMGLGLDGHVWTSHWDHEAKGVTKRALAHPTALKVAHNMAFDMRKLLDDGIEFKGPLFDTMLAAALVQPDLYKGLKKVAPLYLDTSRWDTLSEEDPEFYNAGDVVNTDGLVAPLRAELEKTGQRRLFEDVIMGALPTFVDMTRRGMRVDPVGKDAWIEELGHKEAGLITTWNEIAPGVNPRSPKKLNEYLYHDLGIPVKYSKYGGITSNELALREIMAKFPEHAPKVQTLLDLREVQKLRGTYAEVGLFGDGCVHPNYLPASKDTDNPHGGKGLAGTWRPTASDPNLQNQPMEARKIFVPYEPGMVIMEWDFNQIEARIIATLSGDTALMDAINRGLHRVNMEFLGVDKVRAKNAFYGWSYGAGARTLHNTFRQHGYNIPISTCQQMLDGFNRRYAKAARWREDMMAEAEQKFMVENPFGLRRYWYNKYIGPAAANYVPQSTTAMIIWHTVREVNDALKQFGSGLHIVVHDSYVGCVAGGYERQADEAIRAIVEREWPMIATGFRCPTAVKVGPTWGTVEEQKAWRI